MSTAAPTPLVVRPSTGVVMHSLVQANPAVPATYQPPDVPEVFFQTLQVCRELRREVTVAELAARMGYSPAVAAVAVTELADLDLVRVVRAPEAGPAVPLPQTGTVGIMTNRKCDGSTCCQPGQSGDGHREGGR